MDGFSVIQPFNYYLGFIVMHIHNFAIIINHAIYDINTLILLISNNYRLCSFIQNTEI